MLILMASSSVLYCCAFYFYNSQTDRSGPVLIILITSPDNQPVNVHIYRMSVECRLSPLWTWSFPVDTPTFSSLVSLLIPCFCQVVITNANKLKSGEAQYLKKYLDKSKFTDFKKYKYTKNKFCYSNQTKWNLILPPLPIHNTVH